MKINTLKVLAVTLLTSFALVGCGGGSDDLVVLPAKPPAPTPKPTPAPTPTPTDTPVDADKLLPSFK